MNVVGDSKSDRDADKEYGYRFGVDGLVSAVDTCERLGVSRDKLDSLCHSGRIRKGKDPETGRVFICRRSVEDYIASLEV